MVCNTLWFKKLELIYNENDFHTKPFHIFNCDETGFQCDQGNCKIVCRKGAKHPRVFSNSNDKSMYTVLFCCNAGGEYLSVNIIYKAKNLLSSWCSKGPIDAQYNTSPSGWMESEQFLEWFKSLFLLYAQKLQGKKILFLDGHVSHISLKLIDQAMAKTLYCTDYRLIQHIFFSR
jgi:hypothetical protein